MIILLFSLFFNFVFSQTYLFQSWMEDMSSNSSLYGFDLFDYKIVDIVFPGSHKSGMYEFESGTTIIPDSSFESDLTTYINSTSTYTVWCKRQSVSVLEQLRAGIRFLDLQFYYNGTTYLTHNGIAGALASEIISDINTFITTYGKNELILIYLSKFIDSGSRSTELENLFSLFSTTLGTKMSTTTTSPLITSITLDTLINTNNVRIIAFTDEYSGTPATDAYFYNSTTFFTEPHNITSNSTGTNNIVQTTALKQLRSGWDESTLNIIYWTADLASIGLNHNGYSSFFSYSSSVRFLFSSTYEYYPKLRWANVILEDFISNDDVVELSLLLNINYLKCQDNWFGKDNSDCPALTSLSLNYRTSDITSICSSNTTLNTNCKRSCGTCGYLTGYPGSSCSSDNDCNGTIYDAYKTTSTCFITPDNYETFVTEDSFCMSVSTISTCAAINSTDECSTSDVDVDTSGCGGCASDFQCDSGYCNSDYSVCLSVSDSYGSTPSPTTSSVKYDFIESNLAAQFRDSIDWLRPGDPDGDYTFNVPEGCSGTCYINANPYLKSLLGFIIVPLILSLILLVFYFCCCLPWCCCDNCTKKCCCKCCLTADPRSSLATKWIPFILLASVLIVIVAFCIQGIIANSKMHDHVFGETNSLRYETNRVFTIVLQKFNSVPGLADDVLESIRTLFSIVEGILDSVGDIITAVGDVFTAFGNLATEFTTGLSFSATIVNPLYANQSETVSFNCTACVDLSSEISTINQSVSDTAVEATSTITNALNSTQLLLDANETLQSLVTEFEDSVSSLISSLEKYQNRTDKLLDNYSKYDKKRETGGAVFFALPFVYIVLAIVGLLFKSKWIYKLNWCFAMYIGVAVMALFSFFAIISVGWADLCVRLDDFEKNLQNSQLGEQISDQVDSEQAFEIVNACFYATDMLDIFNLSSMLDWDSYRQNVSDALNIDITKYLENVDLESFTSDVNLLDINNYISDIDDKIDAANAISNCYCNGTIGYEFDFNNLETTECFNDTTYWGTMASSNVDCVENAVTAYSYVQAYNQLEPSITAKLDSIQDKTTDVYSAYDNLYGTVVQLETKLQNITCIIDPLFDQFDAILYNFSNCGFLGSIYGGFKEVGCVLLFKDMYQISRSMMIVAFLSILVVITAMMMDYVVKPSSGKNELNAVERKAAKFSSRALGGFKGGLQPLDDEPGSPRSFNRDMEMTSNRGSNANGNGNGFNPGFQNNSKEPQGEFV